MRQELQELLSEEENKPKKKKKHSDKKKRITTEESQFEDEGFLDVLKSYKGGGGHGSRKEGRPDGRKQDRGGRNKNGLTREEQSIIDCFTGRN